jgi:hypothetical protein
MEEKFEKLIKKDEHQVFVLCCHAYFPFNFFRHPWFVLNDKGEISRWEIRHDINKKDQSHLFINNQPPFEGINKTFLISSKWQAQLIGSIEGEIAKEVITFIKNSKENYSYIKKYFLSGPNSNTYVKWVLDKYPEFKIKLSWRFIGKSYKM